MRTIIIATSVTIVMIAVMSVIVVIIVVFGKCKRASANYIETSRRE